jgi:hypothetical protein
VFKKILSNRYPQISQMTQMKKKRFKKSAEICLYRATGTRASSVDKILMAYEIFKQNTKATCC